MTTSIAQDNKIVILINKSLGMSGGKIAAQAVHAAGAIRNNPTTTVVVLYADNLNDMTLRRQKAKKAGIPVGNIIFDSGLTEVEPFSPTAVAFGPAEKSKFDSITGDLKLV